MKGQRHRKSPIIVDIHWFAAEIVLYKEISNILWNIY